MGDFDETGAEGTLALMNDAPPILSLSAGAQAVSAETNKEFTIPTTKRVFQQGFDSDTCCAHAVAAAMETRMVVNGMDPDATPIDPMMIFGAGFDVRSIHVSRKVAAEGIPTTFGFERATSQFLGKRPIEALVQELKNHVPLVVEVRIDPTFAAYDGADIYRPTGQLVLHALCILGFGTDSLTGESYWIAKNSYGAAWGASGYARLRWGDPFVKPEFKVHVIQSVTP
jgi:hypothetical protein